MDRRVVEAHCGCLPAKGNGLFTARPRKRRWPGYRRLLCCTSCVFGVGGVETMDRQVVEGGILGISQGWRLLITAIAGSLSSKGSGLLTAIASRPPSKDSGLITACG